MLMTINLTIDYYDYRLDDGIIGNLIIGDRSI